jgi:hypothetical protein
MKKPEISENFTVEDIHKIREYHYELTKDMTTEQRATFYHDGAREFKAYLESRKESGATVPA